MLIDVPEEEIHAALSKDGGKTNVIKETDDEYVMSHELWGSTRYFRIRSPRTLFQRVLRFFIYPPKTSSN
jgi:hypothetical protein